MSGIGPVSNPLPALLAFLLAQSSLVAAVTGGNVPSAAASFARIYADGLPSPPIGYTDRPEVLPPTVVIQNARLTGKDNAPAMQTGYFEVRCYDKSVADASALWYVVLNLLRMGTPYRHQGVSVEAQNTFSGPFSGVEPGGGYLMASGSIGLVVLG